MIFHRVISERVMNICHFVGMMLKFVINSMISAQNTNISFYRISPDIFRQSTVILVFPASPELENVGFSSLFFAAPTLSTMIYK